MHVPDQSTPQQAPPRQSSQDAATESQPTTLAQASGPESPVAPISATEGEQATLFRDPGQSGQAGESRMINIRSEFSGPIPAPHHMAQYNQIIPNGGDRLVSMAEREMEHRQDVEKEEARNRRAKDDMEHRERMAEIRGETQVRTISAVGAPLLGVTAIIAAVVLGLCGQDTLAAKIIEMMAAVFGGGYVGGLLLDFYKSKGRRRGSNLPDANHLEQKTE